MNAVQALLDGIWAIEATFLHRLEAVAAIADPEERRELAASLRTTSTPVKAAGDTAVIPIVGPITKRPDIFASLFGLDGTTTGGIRARLDRALADPRVGRILLHVDSPGGEVDGITELAGAIRAARAIKPVTAWVDSMAASAGYWLAAQANDMHVTPSGSVGSVGVFSLHLDRSKMLEQIGLTPTYIQAGKYKTEESPLQPLSADAKAEIQKRVDAFHSMFVRDVALGRGVTESTVRTQYGEGRLVLARDAVRLGMADAVRDEPPIMSGPSAAIIAQANAILAKVGFTDPELVFAAAQATVTIEGARAKLEAFDAAQQYVLVDQDEVHPVKLALAIAAREIAALELRITPPRIAFFVPDDGRAGGEHFAHPRELDGDYAEGRIRVRADVDTGRLIAAVAHEVCHAAQHPVDPIDERERRAQAYEDGFEQRFWRSPQAEAVVAHFRRERAA